ncbi:CPS_collapsed_G0048630.mRNA.1.CDS.1 [Saccharomyces cerevisiae]|nr:CPS_collapsed_G0048630.mRNA.1.CDS.1 [Saccharomyces cerevisiae]
MVEQQANQGRLLSLHLSSPHYQWFFQASGLKIQARILIFTDLNRKSLIPAYLIGIASGDLSSAPIGPRSTVYTEPFRLKDCQWNLKTM